MNSPLQLKDYSFLKICVEVNSAQEGQVSKSIGVDSQVKLGEVDDESVWIVVLTVELKESTEPGRSSAYKAEVSVMGRFSVDDNYPKEKTPRMVAVTGASLLYGVIREMLANITARSIHGEYMLPLTSFADLNPQKPDLVAED